MNHKPLTLKVKNDDLVDKIRIIKTLRVITGLTLLESKVVTERLLEVNEVLILVNVDFDTLNEHLNTLKMFGVEVVDGTVEMIENRENLDKVLSEIKKLSITAIELKQYKLANSLIYLLQAN